MLAILRWIKRLAPLANVTPEIYLLTSSEACAMALEEGIAAFKIPSKTVIKKTDIPKENFLRLAKQWIWHSIGLLRPDILLVDTFPAGTFGELFQALDGPKAKVLIYRAVKDSFAKQEAISALLPLYDRVLLPEEAGQPPREVSAALEQKARRVGPITLRSIEELRPRGEARSRLGVAPESLAVFVTAGGGGDPNAEKVLLSLITLLRAQQDVHVIVGAGPLYQGEVVRGPGVTWLTGFFASEDFLGLDVAISAAGYNSFHELLQAGVPTIFYHQEKIADEQHRRADAAFQHNAALRLSVNDAGELQPDELLSLLSQMRDPARRAQLSQNARTLVPKSFAREAAAHVLSTLVPKRSIDDALKLGDSKFFASIERQQISFQQAVEILSMLAPDEALSAGERRALFASLLPSLQPDSLSVFSALYRKLPAPKDFNDASSLCSFVTQIVAELSLFQDERGALSFIRSISITKQTPLTELQDGLIRLFSLLRERGETLFRGQASVSKHMGPPSQEETLMRALQLACQEFSS
jgi:UDP-N-acetylglucosamine--N-acetylmuramyl-(pentapeptide) pyrophosphoryl-undecaprenol N-acetylglucosamine transferase